MRPRTRWRYQELGRVQCMELNWYSASESLKKALAAGAGPEARLMRAEALVWAGTPDEATAELNLYLNGREPQKYATAGPINPGEYPGQEEG